MITSNSVNHTLKTAPLVGRDVGWSAHNACLRWVHSYWNSLGNFCWDLVEFMRFFLFLIHKMGQIPQLSAVYVWLWPPSNRLTSKYPLPSQSLLQSTWPLSPAPVPPFPKNSSLRALAIINLSLFQKPRVAMAWLQSMSWMIPPSSQSPKAPPPSAPKKHKIWTKIVCWYSNAHSRHALYACLPTWYLPLAKLHGNSGAFKRRLSSKSLLHTWLYLTRYYHMLPCIVLTYLFPQVLILDKAKLLNRRKLLSALYYCVRGTSQEAWQSQESTNY